MPAAIFNSTAIKILKDILKFRSGLLITTQGAVDPSAVSTPGNPGDLYIRTSGEIYRKTDSGSSTNWSEVIDVTSLAAELANYIPTSEKGASLGVATLDAGGKVPVSQLPSSVMEYKGTWNASTNSPTLADGVGDAGDVYIVSVAGTQNLGSGSISFDVGDWVVYNGTIWQKSSNSNSVVSVNGFTGVVSLTTDDIPEGTELYFTDLRAQNAMTGAISTVTTTDLTPNMVLQSDGSGKITNSTVTQTEVEYLSGVTSAIQTQLNNKQPLDATLTALAAYNTNGLVTQTSADTFTGRTITAGSSKVTVTNGSGVAGNPAIDVSEANLDISNMTGTLGINHGGTGQTTATAAFNALSPVTTKGDLIVRDSTNNVRLAAGNKRQSLTADADATEGVFWSNEVINYIKNPDAELATTGWAAYADAAQSTPVDGTGGSPTVTITRSTSSPLRGAASFLITKDAANRQGQGVSYDFTIDSADATKVLSLTMDYTIASGTYSGGTSSTDSDVVCYIYDVTNSVLIQPTPFKLDGAVVDQKYTLRTIFQATTSTSYRLIFHVATTSASAYTIKYDNVVLSPQVSSYAAVVSDWVSYTPTITGCGTVSLDGFFWRRVGDSLEIKGTFVTGTVASSVFSVSIPSGLVIDSAKNSSTTDTNSHGHLYGLENTNADWFATINGGPFVVFSDTATSNTLLYAAQDVSSSRLSRDNGDEMMSSTTRGRVEAAGIPISGWSSSLQISDQSDGRIVAARYYVSSGSSTTGLTQINFDTKDFDTHAAVTTGASSWKFTAPLPGVYLVSASVYFGGTSSAYFVYKNGSLYAQLGNSLASTAMSTGSTLVNLVAGDYIDIRPNSTATPTAASPASVGQLNNVEVSRVSGNSVPFALETVSARYYASATSISGSLATISWTTKDFDTHSAMSAGSYTVPVAGKYAVSSALLVSGTVALNNTLIVEIQKNGSVVSRETQYAGGAMTNIKGRIADTISCVAGDIIRIQVSCSATGPSIVSSNFDNYMSITKVGN